MSVESAAADAGPASAAAALVSLAASATPMPPLMWYMRNCVPVAARRETRCMYLLSGVQAGENDGILRFAREFARLGAVDLRDPQVVAAVTVADERDPLAIRRHLAAARRSGVPSVMRVASPPVDRQRVEVAEQLEQRATCHPASRPARSRSPRRSRTRAFLRGFERQLVLVRLLLLRRRVLLLRRLRILRFVLRDHRARRQRARGQQHEKST